MIFAVKSLFLDAFNMDNKAIETRGFEVLLSIDNTLLLKRPLPLQVAVFLC